MSSEILNSCKELLVDIIDGICVLAININRPSAAQVEEFKVTLNDVLSYSLNKKVIVDFTNCSYPDSVMLGTMIKTQREIQKRGGSVVAVASTLKLKLLFGQVGIEKVIKNYDSKEEAIASFAV